MKFDLGQVIVTPTAGKALAAAGQSAEEMLCRHQAGDWGDVSEQERRINERALAAAITLMSKYRTRRGDRLQVVTKPDRSLTVVHIDPRG
jgi:hypothetical protein